MKTVGAAVESGVLLKNVSSLGNDVAEAPTLGKYQVVDQAAALLATFGGHLLPDGRGQVKVLVLGKWRITSAVYYCSTPCCGC